MLWVSIFAETILIEPAVVRVAAWLPPRGGQGDVSHARPRGGAQGQTLEGAFKNILLELPLEWPEVSQGRAALAQIAAQQPLGLDAWRNDANFISGEGFSEKGKTPTFRAGAHGASPARSRGKGAAENAQGSRAVRGRAVQARGRDGFAQMRFSPTWGSC